MERKRGEYMSTHLQNIEGAVMEGKLPDVRLASTPFKVVAPYEPQAISPRPSLIW